MRPQIGFPTYQCTLRETRRAWDGASPAHEQVLCTTSIRTSSCICRIHIQYSSKVTNCMVRVLVVLCHRFLTRATSRPGNCAYTEIPTVGPKARPLRPKLEPRNLLTMSESPYKAPLPYAAVTAGGQAESMRNLNGLSRVSPGQPSIICLPL